MVAVALALALLLALALAECALVVVLDDDGGARGAPYLQRLQWAT